MLFVTLVAGDDDDDDDSGDDDGDSDGDVDDDKDDDDDDDDDDDVDDDDNDDYGDETKMPSLIFQVHDNSYNHLKIHKNKISSQNIIIYSNNLIKKTP